MAVPSVTIRLRVNALFPQLFPFLPILPGSFRKVHMAVRQFLHAVNLQMKKPWHEGIVLSGCADKESVTIKRLGLLHG
jgi:hypothetical protein